MNDIFLSHSHLDKDAALQIERDLTVAGLSVYADFKDSFFQQQTASLDRDAVERLLKNLHNCRICVFIATAESSNSRWVAWEVGMAHGAVGHVLIWPVDAQAVQAYEQHEYLKLYDMLDSPDRKERIQSLKQRAKDAKVTSTPPGLLKSIEIGGEQSAAVRGHPELWLEYVVLGPLRLYFTWLNTVARAVPGINELLRAFPGLAESMHTFPDTLRSQSTATPGGIIRLSDAVRQMQKGFR